MHQGAHAGLSALQVQDLLLGGGDEEGDEDEEEEAPPLHALEQEQQVDPLFSLCA